MLVRSAAIAIVVAFGSLYAFVRLTDWFSSEKAIPYTVSSPKKSSPPVDWDKHEPAIKISGSSAIHCYAPATGEFLGLVNPATPAGIDRAVEQAKVAQEKWARTTFTQRRQVLRTLLKFVLENKEEICRIACLDSGKTMIDAMLGETLVTAEKLTWTLKHGEKALRPSRRPTNVLLAYKKNEVRYEPLGVVAALISWNYPFHNLIGPVISAIFAGNGIIVKSSEQTSWSANYFMTIVKGALDVCGHDPNLVQTVACWPQVANHLSSHPDISHVTFIGSRPVAHHVAAACAKSLTPLCAELGGKDAYIVLDSAKNDLNRIVDVAMRGTFQSSGQNCVGIERIICCSQVYDKVVEMLEPRVKSMRLGSILDAKDGEDIDMGAMISTAPFDRLEWLIQDAVKKGARLLAGGSRYHHPVHKRGVYFQPTLIVDVTTDMALANEECFAPICTVMKATHVADAVRIANDPNFGLGASIYGKEDYDLWEAVRAIRSGMVAVNDFAVFYAVQLPFGGVGGSGYGRFAGEEGLRAVCNLKAISMDRLGWLGVRTAIPSGLAYPIRSTRKGWNFVSALVEFGYAPAMWVKAKALGKMGANS